MHRNLMVLLIAAVATRLFDNRAAAQMIPLARDSSVSASFGRNGAGQPPPVSESRRTTGFEDFRETVSASSSSASQVSTVRPGAVTFSGMGYGFGGGGFVGYGRSGLVFDFRLVQECSFTLVGTVGGFQTSGLSSVSLIRTDTANTIFDTSSFGDFQNSGTLLAGLYRLNCSAGGLINAPTATLNATLTVVPAPSTVVAAMLGFVATARRRREIPVRMCI